MDLIYQFCLQIAEDRQMLLGFCARVHPKRGACRNARPLGVPKPPRAVIGMAQRLVEQVDPRLLSACANKFIEIFG